MTCPACGATMADDARFCAACGRAVHVAEDERRVVTVVFADLVGYTTLSERLDPELVKNLVDRCFDRLAADVTTFGGQVDKIVGDALVAMFGATVAHEDDAERAVRAALRMQQTLETEAESTGHALRMRVGVNTGEVLVGAMRAAGSVTAMGDVVNTASRLQAAARPGEVLVGPATHAATSATIAYEERGPVAAKGREVPVETWRALSPVVPPGYRPRREGVELVGRRHEMGLLQRAIDLSVTNQRGGLVLILGDVGLGKARLSDEICGWARANHRAVVREGRCVPYGEANVWWPIADALRGALNLEEGVAREVARATLAEEVRATLSEGTDPAEIERTVEGLLTLMGYDPADSSDLAARHRAASLALTDYLAATASRRPLLLRFSDLHFADDVVLALLDEVFDRLHHRPVVVVATARPTLLERWTPRAGRHNNLVVHLDPLSQQATADLLEGLSGGPVSSEVASAFYNRSGGNPLYVEELVALIEGQEVDDEPAAHEHAAHEHAAHEHAAHNHGRGRGAPGRITRAAAFPDTLPDTLRGLLAARLDDLDPGPRAVLQDAAVLGVRGTVDALERMAESLHRPVKVTEALSRLVSEELMRLDGHRWSFRSDLVREVAYQTITKTDRAVRHHGIAVYLEHSVAADARPVWVVAQLAHHYAEAAELVEEIGPLGPSHKFPPDLSDRARRWVVAAGERARRDLALPTARRHFEKALGLLGPDTDARAAEAVPLLTELTSVSIDLWDLECAQRHIAHAERLVATLDDPVATAGVLVARAAVEMRSGDPSTAVESLTEAVALYGDRGDHAGRARALRERAMVQIIDGRMQEAEQSAGEALAEFELLGDSAGQGWAHQNLAWIAFVTGRTALADDHAEAAVERFASINDVRGTGWAWGIQAWIRFQQGHTDDASQLGSKALVKARELEDPWAVGMCQLLLASVELWSGRTDQAVEQAREVLLQFERIGDAWGRGQASAVLGRATVMTGDVEAGLDLLTAAVGGAAEGGSTTGQAAGLARVGVAIQLGLPELAVGSENELTALAEQGSQDAVAALGMLALQRGDAELAGSYLFRDEVTPPNANLSVARALVAAVTGRGDPESLVAAALARDGATYLDRALGEIALALQAARSEPLDGSDRAVEHLALARQALEGTGDRVAHAVVGLVESRLGRPAGSADGPAAGEITAAELGFDGAGWLALVDSALGARTR